MSAKEFNTGQCAHEQAKNHATVMINAAAGWDPKMDAPDRLRAIFDAHGWDTEIERLEHGKNITDIARTAVGKGCGIVVAAGGDGTLNATASALVGTGCALGILPAGTLNHLARDLGLPLDIEQAAHIVATGRVVQVDVGEVNGRIFLNNSVIGLYPAYRFAKDREIKKGTDRRFAFLWAVYTIFRRNPFMRVRLSTGGQTIERRTPYILIANNEHAMEGYRLGQRQTLAGGKLWIYVMRRRGRWGLFRMMLSLLFGRFSAARDFLVFPVEELWVDTRRKRLGVALDGEIARLETPLHYRILPKALNVIVPADSPSA